jgi:hypothetical protein
MILIDYYDTYIKMGITIFILVSSFIIVTTLYGLSCIFIRRLSDGFNKVFGDFTRM